jgi:hypothetical protein
MRNEWYGDKHDLVKWGTILYLASNPPAGILQVAMLRPDAKNGFSLKEKGPQGNRVHPISERVFEHFRAIRNIACLRRHIVIYDRPFLADDEEGQDGRGRYFMGVRERIKRAGRRRLVVLADPDTGIRPRRLGRQHIAAEELRQLYLAIKDGDTLVLYQHRRRCHDWLDVTLREFARSIGVQVNKVRVFQCFKLASNVALFAITKSHSE